MKSAVENLSPTRVKLTVEVPFEELKPSLDAAYKAIGQQIQVPGFRKGKVPARIIEQRVGRGAVLEEAVNNALPEFYGQALTEQKLSPLSQPEVSDLKVPAEDGEEFSFVAELDVRPEIELPDFSAIAVEVDPVQVSDEDVAQRLESLRERFGTLKTVERPVADGDFLTIDLSATIGSEEIDFVKGISYEVGSQNMLDGLDEAVMGLSAGQSKEFTAALMGGEHAGEDANCIVTVEAVKERELPELDDEFAQLASEFDTLEELKADAVKQAELQARYAQGMQARDKVVDAIVEQLDVPVPDSLIEGEVSRHLEGEGRQEDEEHRAEVSESSKKQFQVQFVLDTIVERDEISVEQPELIEYIVMSAQQYGIDPNQFAQMIDQQGQIPMIVGEVARRKALASILESVKVTDTNGEVVDLNAIGGNEAEETAGAAEAQDAKA